ncbi:response regulator transcription factor [Microbacterium sp.]|uniref:response regulator transcription factor n=1 Tax=Microbacterium sp. TaxID=51671 RepID=UPI002FE1AEDA
MESLLDDLLAARVSCAPHVLTVLVEQLHGDRSAILQVAETLTAAQRHGVSSLPVPLPCVAAISDAFRALELTAEDRELLLALALHLDDRLAPILEFDGRSAAEIAEGSLGVHIAIRAGSIRLVDPRLAVWVQSTTTAGQQAAVHGRLSAVFDARGDRMQRDWHRARASLQRRPASASTLIRSARELTETGRPLRALRLADEAAAHATGAAQEMAQLAAGVAAAAAGLSDEASARLSRLFPAGAERFRLQALSGRICAQAFLQGTVPDPAPAAFGPRTDDGDNWLAWSRAAAFAAILSAERGDRRTMRLWLDTVHDGTARVADGRALHDSAVELSWLLIGEPESGPGEAPGVEVPSARIVRALRAALEDDIDGALRMLAADGPCVPADPDPLLTGFEHSPVVRAYLAVTEVLLLLWRGDVGVARDRMIAASFDLPVTIPFAGLGVILARRLDIAVLGELGPVSRALSTALPAPVRFDLLVDRSIRSSLAGAFDDAESARRLWLELGAPQSGFAVPGIDGASTRSEGNRRRVLRPPGMALASELRRRSASMTESGWRVQRQEIRDALRGVRSPFERATVESAIGVQCAIRADHVAARAHLRTAIGLFEISGASAWARSVQDRLDSWDRLGDPDALPSDSMAACRRTWSELLTARELEVAMLTVGGATNREISDTLRVSVRTVEVHLGRVFAKLDVRTRVELTVLAHRTNRHG